MPTVAKYYLNYIKLKIKKQKPTKNWGWLPVLQKGKLFLIIFSAMSWCLIFYWLTRWALFSMLLGQ
jgi:hypothetical protein